MCCMLIINKVGLCGVHADAIMDRIVHNAAWVEMGDMNMRQAMAGKGR